MNFQDFKSLVEKQQNLVLTGGSEQEQENNREIILEIVKSINNSLILEDVLMTVLKGALKTTKSERGFILLKDKKDELEYKIGINVLGEKLSESDFSVSSSVVQEVYESGHSKFIEGAQKDPAHKNNKSIFSLNLQTILCAPLKTNDDKIGILYVDSRLFHKVKTQAIIETFEIIAGQAATAIKNAQLYEDLKAAKVKAENSDKLKSEFLAQMSHEIRTPINTVLSFTSLLQEALEEDLPADLEDSFTIVNSAGKRIIRTVDLLLEMSQIQTENYEYIPIKFDLAKLLTEIHKEFLHAAKGKQLRLEFVDEAENKTVYADRYMVQQIFQNLLDNALKYTFEGYIKIRVYNKQGGKVFADITDSGIGISEEYIDQLFQPFSQEETGYTRKFEGNGLGLALVRKYIDLNKAVINVHSKKGSGSTFSVGFPSK